MKRYSYILCAMVLLAVLVFTGCGAYKKDAAVKDGDDAELGVRYVRQLVMEDNALGRTLMWNSDAKQNFILEYRKQGTEAVLTKQAADNSFQDGSASYIQYSVQLTGLERGAEYEYRIKSGAKVGKWHRLLLDRDAAFKVLIFPDSQSADYSGWRKLARGAVEREKDAELYINMGDLVDNGADEGQWRSWLESVESFSDGMAFAPVIGNHETYDKNYKFRLPATYRQLFQLPQNGLAHYKHQFYSFDYGMVHFTVVDTNFYELGNLQPQLLEDELRWLERDLAKSGAKWKVVLQHRDVMIYGFGPESGRARTQTRFDDEGHWLMPIYEKYGVDAVLSAHLHTYRRRVPIRNYRAAEDGVTYILTGVAGDVRYPRLWEEGWLDVAKAPQPETANYLTLEADKNSLRFKAFLPDGTQFDEVLLQK